MRENLKGCVKDPGADEPLTWRAARTLYQAALSRRGLSGSALRHSAWTLRLLEPFLVSRGRTAPARVRVADLVAFGVWTRDRRVGYGRRRGERVGDATVRIWWQNARAFFRWLVRDGHLLTDPAVVLEPIPRPRSLPRVLSFREMDRLLAATAGTTQQDRRDRALVELGYACALRAGELLGLDLLDLDLSAGEVLIRCGKGGHARRLPMGGPATRAVMVYLSAARDTFIPARLAVRPAALFVSRRGTRLRQDLACRALARRARDAKISGRVTWHTLRHTAAVHMLSRGADIAHVAALLGHAAPETTVRYTRLVLADLKEALARAHPRSRWAI